MAEEKKNVTGKVEQATTDTKKAAEKVAKAAKGDKNKKPNISVRMKKGAAKAKTSTVKFFKDFKGESKKIVWPDAKTVLKNTGIVLLVVAAVALVVLAIDGVLAFIIEGLQKLATGSTETTTAVSNAVSTTVATTAASTTTTTASTTVPTTAGTTVAGMIGFFSSLVG